MADQIGSVQALKEFFGTEERPVTNSELMDLRKHSAEGYRELAQGAEEALGKTLKA